MASSTAMTVSNDKLQPFRDALTRAQTSFQQALPATVAKFLTPERMTKVVLSAIARTPILLQCTPTSILKCVMEASSLGLEPTGGVLGHAYMVPFRNSRNNTQEAQLIVGYRGLIELARRSGNIKAVEAHVVYAKDKFELSFGLEPRMVHTPALTGERGDIIAAYCVANFTDGSRHCEVMTRAEIDAVRQRSRARDNGPWATDYAEMARKTVVRRAAKYWPLSTEQISGLVRALEIEDAAESAVDIQPTFDAQEPMVAQVVESASKRKTSKLAAKIAGNQDVQHDPQTGEVKADEPPPAEDDYSDIDTSHLDEPGSDG